MSELAKSHGGPVSHIQPAGSSFFLLSVEKSVKPPRKLHELCSVNTITLLRRFQPPRTIRGTSERAFVWSCVPREGFPLYGPCEGRRRRDDVSQGVNRAQGYKSVISPILLACRTAWPARSQPVQGASIKSHTRSRAPHNTCSI